jgi:PKD domain-containing protein/gametolysin peptidase M11
MKKAVGAFFLLLSPFLVPAVAVAERVEAEGRLNVLVEDDFDASTARTAYRLETDDGGSVALDFGSSPPGMSLRTGARIRVAGLSDGETLVVESAERVSTVEPLEADQFTSTWTTGAKKVLLIRFNYKNDTSQPYSDTTSNNVMFGATGSVAAFYKEGSFGLTTHSGDITPWLTVNLNKPTTCDPFSGSSQADTLAKAAGFDPTKYNFYVYVFPHLPCGWAGLGSVGGPGAWINQALSTYVVAHELGHNYGLLHAHSRDCGSTPVSVAGACVESEYGDPFDTMGNANRQFNAFSKYQLGWLPGAGDVATRSSGSGTYTLSPLEASSGLRAVQVVTGGASGTYWIEFRQASSGFDAGLPVNVTTGALIHVGPSADWGTDLLDMTTGTATFGDAALDVGKTFVDSAGGVSIKTLSQSGATVTVQVQFGAQPPSAAFTFAPTAPLADHGVLFQDSSSAVATAWSWDFGDGTTSTLKNPTHFYAATGSHTITLAASNGSGNFVPAANAISVAANPARSFYTLTPCRAIDTRNATGTYGGPALAAGATRNFTLTGQCGIPATAKAVSLNITVTGPTGAGDLRVFAVGAPDLGADTIRFGAGQTRANNAVLELGASGNLSVACEMPSGTVQFILDVNGYLQ